MMAAYLMIAMDEHASFLSHLAQIGMSVDLAESKVLPV